MSGVYDPSIHVVAAIPVFAWEVSLAGYLIVNGFKTAPVTPTDATTVRVPAPLPVG